MISACSAARDPPTLCSPSFIDRSEYTGTSPGYHRPPIPRRRRPAALLALTTAAHGGAGRHEQVRRLYRECSASQLIHYDQVIHTDPPPGWQVCSGNGRIKFPINGAAAGKRKTRSGVSGLLPEAGTHHSPCEPRTSSARCVPFAHLSGVPGLRSPILHRISERVATSDSHGSPRGSGIESDRDRGYLLQISPRRCRIGRPFFFEITAHGRVSRVGNFKACRGDESAIRERATLSRSLVLRACAPPSRILATFLVTGRIGDPSPADRLDCGSRQEMAQLNRGRRCLLTAFHAALRRLRQPLHHHLKRPLVRTTRLCPRRRIA